MKLSVIVICLNEAQHLARCLRALTECDRHGLAVEIVVVDGGSTDGSASIARAYGARVIDSAKGIPLQRNVGARAATGDVLAYVDADVEVLDGWFSAVARHFGEKQRKILGSPPRLPHDASWIARAYALHRGVDVEGSTRTDAGHHGLLSTQSLVLGRQVFEDVGGFCERLGVDEDTVFLIEAQKRDIPLLCDSSLAYIHYGEPRTLWEFFRRTRWGTNSQAWYQSILRGDVLMARRHQYLYGAAIALEVGLLGVSVLAASAWNWHAAIPLCVALLAISFLAPAVSTAVRRESPRKIGDLCLMYAALGLATASAIAGLGWNKDKRWR